MKRILVLFVLILSVFNIYAQSAIKLNDAEPITYDGYEYGFSIDRKTGWKTFWSGTEYEEYQVSFYVKNKSGKDWLKFIYSDGKNKICDYLAEFNCLNAINRHNSYTNVFLYGKPKTAPYVQHSYITTYFNSTPIIYNTASSQELLIGYLLDNNDIVTASVNVVVPKGEQMIWKVKPFGR